MSDLAEQSRLHDRFAEMCRPVAADYAKGTIDRQTAVDRMEQRRSFLNVDPHAGGVIINSQLTGAETERKIRAKIGGRPNGQATPPPEYQVQPRSGLALLDKAIPPLKWVLPGYIPQGCTLLASKPKIGKSHLIVALSYAISTGGQFFHANCAQRKVLYLALEESERALQSRMFRTAPRDNWREGFDYDMQLANLDRGGIADLTRVITQYHYGVVFIDTMAAIKGTAKKGQTEYQHDYATIAPFRDLARETETGIILLHHVRKAKDNADVFDSVLGTGGLNGAADTTVVLTKAETGLRWYGRGREAEEIDKIVDADLATNTWTVMGDYEHDPQTAATRDRILTTLRTSPKGYPMTPKDIAAAIGVPEGAVRVALRRLAKAGKVVQPSRGYYAH